jgi:hypothetical protein
VLSRAIVCYLSRVIVCYRVLSCVIMCYRVLSCDHRCSVVPCAVRPRTVVVQAVTAKASAYSGRDLALIATAFVGASVQVPNMFTAIAQNITRRMDVMDTFTTRYAVNVAWCVGHRSHTLSSCPSSSRTHIQLHSRAQSHTITRASPFA